MRGRRIAEVEREAAFCSAAASSFLRICMVSSEHCEIRFVLKSARWNTISESGVSLELERGVLLISSLSSHSSLLSIASSVSSRSEFLPSLSVLLSAKDLIKAQLSDILDSVIRSTFACKGHDQLI